MCCRRSVKWGRGLTSKHRDERRYDTNRKAGGSLRREESNSGVEQASASIQESARGLATGLFVLRVALLAVAARGRAWYAPGATAQATGTISASSSSSASAGQQFH